MMLHGSQPQSPSPPAATQTTTTDTAATHDQHAGRKRKAAYQDNERLSKRLSLLNLEHNGSKLYVPVENPSAEASKPVSTGTTTSSGPQPHPSRIDDGADDAMHLDDSKYKVYIYNIDDELSSDDDSADDGRLVFLPDIEKHLKETRIPPQVLANSDGELAGMQMVLYSDPKSLSVPEDRDSVRKAILESRRRLRERQNPGNDGDAASGNATTGPNTGRASAEPSPAVDDPEAMDMD